MDVLPTGACGSVLGKLLRCREICKHVPGRERIRSMRYLYTMLQWASQRTAEQVRARVERTPHVSRAGHVQLVHHLQLVHQLLMR